MLIFDSIDYDINFTLLTCQEGSVKYFFRRKCTAGDITMGIYLIKSKNRNTKARCKICSKLTIKTKERSQWHHSDVFIVNFEQILQLALVLLLINFSSLPTELVPSLTRLKKHGSGLKFFVLIFQKLEEIKIWHWAK